MLLDLLQDLSSENNDGCGAVSYFGVLRPGDVDEDAGGGVDDVEELDQTSKSSVDIGSAYRVVRTFMTVAPSLVMVCWPFSSTINRSPPYGPRVGFIVA